MLPFAASTTARNFPSIDEIVQRDTSMGLGGLLRVLRSTVVVKTNFRILQAAAQLWATPAVMTMLHHHLYHVVFLLRVPPVLHSAAACWLALSLPVTRHSRTKMRYLLHCRQGAQATKTAKTRTCSLMLLDPFVDFHPLSGVQGGCPPPKQDRRSHGQICLRILERTQQAKPAYSSTQLPACPLLVQSQAPFVPSPPCPPPAT